MCIRDRSSPVLKLFVHENIVDLENSLYLYNDSIICHIRTVSEIFNANVDWDEDTQSLQISRKGTVIKLNIDNINYTVNGVSKTFKCAPRYIQEKIYVPLQEIVENLGYNYYTDLHAGNVYVYNTAELPTIPPQITLNRNEYIKNPDIDEDIYIKIDYNGTSLEKIILDNYTLIKDAEYEMVGNYVVLKKEFVRTLTNGNAKFSLVFENDITLYADISVIPQIYTPQKSVYKLFFDNEEIITLRCQ